MSFSFFFFLVFLLCTSLLYTRDDATLTASVCAKYSSSVVIKFRGLKFFFVKFEEIFCDDKKDFLGVFKTLSSTIEGPQAFDAFRKLQGNLPSRHKRFLDALLDASADKLQIRDTRMFEKLTRSFFFLLKFPSRCINIKNLTQRSFHRITSLPAICDPIILPSPLYFELFTLSIDASFVVFFVCLSIANRAQKNFTIGNEIDYKNVQHCVGFRGGKVLARFHAVAAFEPRLIQLRFFDEALSGKYYRIFGSFIFFAFVSLHVCGFDC